MMYLRLFPFVAVIVVPDIILDHSFFSLRHIGFRYVINNACPLFFKTERHIKQIIQCIADRRLLIELRVKQYKSAAPSTQHLAAERTGFFRLLIYLINFFC